MYLCTSERALVIANVLVNSGKWHKKSWTNTVYAFETKINIFHCLQYHVQNCSSHCQNSMGSYENICRRRWEVRMRSGVTRRRQKHRRCRRLKMALPVLHCKGFSPLQCNTGRGYEACENLPNEQEREDVQWFTMFFLSSILLHIVGQCFISTAHIVSTYLFLLLL